MQDNKGITIKEQGQVAFEAYRETVNGVAYDGTPIPPWEALSLTVKAGWRAAAHAVVQAHFERRYSILSD